MGRVFGRVWPFDRTAARRAMGEIRCDGGAVRACARIGPCMILPCLIACGAGWSFPWAAPGSRSRCPAPASSSGRSLGSSFSKDAIRAESNLSSNRMRYWPLPIAQTARCCARTVGISSFSGHPRLGRSNNGLSVFSITHNLRTLPSVPMNTLNSTWPLIVFL